MASTYTASTLQDAIYTAKKKDAFQALELRGSVYGALDVASAQTELLLPKTIIEKIKLADQQAVKIDVFKRESMSIGSSVACDFTGAGATARQTLSWEPIVVGFHLSHGDMAANRYTYEEMFQMRFEEAMKSMYAGIDEYVVATGLEGGYNSGAGNLFPLYNNAFQVSQSNYDITTNRAARWLNKVKADFRKNDLSGDNIHFVGDANLMDVMSMALNQGQGTSTNLGFMFQGITSNFTNRVVNNDGIYATGYAFEKGAFGILDWIDPLFRVGKTIETDEWTSFREPRYGMTIGVKIKRQCKDNSSVLSGSLMTADFQESWQFVVQVAVPTAYSSEADQTFIYKYELNEDDSVLSGSGSY